MSQVTHFNINITVPGNLKEAYSRLLEIMGEVERRNGGVTWQSESASSDQEDYSEEEFAEVITQVLGEV